ncbi:MAG: histidinol-phosphate transaminase [Gemmataceae bacterium]|nr:histidinol-phosphate transaminase [Gemmataceae bacterium]
MRGYVPGEQLNSPDIVKLNTNENPYPPSPRVFEAVRAALTGDKLRKYPQPLGDDFRRAAGRVLNIDPDSILIGNGSDDLLTILTRAFVPEGGLVVSPTPSYILYRELAAIQGARFETVRFTEEWSLPFPWPKPDADIVFIPNPNSPTGTLLPLGPGHLEPFADRFRGPVVLDQAYVDFAEDDTLATSAGWLPNVIVTRTLSKGYSLAGIRFGFALAHPDTIRELVKVKDSYNCDVLSLAAATAAIEDQDYYRGVWAKVVATRERMRVELRELGFDVTPSRANFLWCRRADRPVKPIYEALKHRNILVRYMDYAGYDGLRISVGTDAEVDRLLTELRSILAG